MEFNREQTKSSFGSPKSRNYCTSRLEDEVIYKSRAVLLLVNQVGLVKSKRRILKVA
jgi:hypothetical protein